MLSLTEEISSQSSDTHLREAESPDEADNQKANSKKVFESDDQDVGGDLGADWLRNNY